MYNLLLKLFYIVKPLVPRTLQIWFRKVTLKRKREKFADIWPILEQAGDQPDGFKGWPEGKRFAVVLTHDVETSRGHRRCLNLSSLEKDLGFRSSFNFVPERYAVSPEIRTELVKNGFEVGVHGLNHDGKLYKNHRIFQERAKRINRYLEEWNAVGFRSPAMHHNLEWLHSLNIEYDASTFDVDPFEPQPDGVGTIFPFYVQSRNRRTGYVELPYTLPQDFTIFILFGETNIDTWKKKLDWIVNKGGVALLNTHPDYMSLEAKPQVDEFPAQLYLEFLKYIKETYKDQYWNPLPCDLARFWVREHGAGSDLMQENTTSSVETK